MLKCISPIQVHPIVALIDLMFSNWMKKEYLRIPLAFLFKFSPIQIISITRTFELVTSDPPDRECSEPLTVCDYLIKSSVFLSEPPNTVTSVTPNKHRLKIFWLY